VALPGVLVGVGGAWLGRSQSIAFAAVCGVIGLGFGVFSQWAQFPFIENKSLGFFLSHMLNLLRPISLILIGLGGAAAFWFAWRGKTRRAHAA